MEASAVVSPGQVRLVGVCEDSRWSYGVTAFGVGYGKAKSTSHSVFSTASSSHIPDETLLAFRVTTDVQTSSLLAVPFEAESRSSTSSSPAQLRLSSSSSTVSRELLGALALEPSPPKPGLSSSQAARPLI